MPRHICPVVYDRELPGASSLSPRCRLLDEIDAVADQILQRLLAWGVEPRADYYAKAIFFVEAMQNNGLFDQKRLNTHGINHIRFEFESPVNPLLEHLICLVHLILSRYKQPNNPVRRHKRPVSTLVLNLLHHICDA